VLDTKWPISEADSLCPPPQVAFVPIADLMQFTGLDTGGADSHVRERVSLRALS
jgi:hypothetical protein